MSIQKLAIPTTKVVLTTRNKLGRLKISGLGMHNTHKTPVQNNKWSNNKNRSYPVVFRVFFESVQVGKIWVNTALGTACLKCMPKMQTMVFDCWCCWYHIAYRVNPCYATLCVLGGEYFRSLTSISISQTTSVSRDVKHLECTMTKDKLSLVKGLRLM